MSIQFPAIQDTIVAILVIVGIAVALSVAFGAAASFYLRSKARRTGHGAAAITHAAIEHPTQTDSPVSSDRELVLR